MLLLLRRRRAASLVSLVPSDEDISAASRRSKALPALQDYHISKDNVAAATLVSSPEHYMAARKMRLAGYGLDDACRTTTTPNERPILERVDGWDDIPLPSGRLPVWVKRVGLTAYRRLPLYPRQRTSSVRPGRSVSCHNSCTAANVAVIQSSRRQGLQIAPAAWILARIHSLT